MADQSSSRSRKGKGKVADTGPADGILQEIPPPVATLDLADTENLEKNYKDFVEKLIQTMKEETDVEFQFFNEDKEVKQSVLGNEAKEMKHSVPVTPGVDYTPRGNFSFDLLVGDTRLRLVCDKYQFWFRGIVTADGKRYEIDDDKVPNVMRGSSSLYTTGMYPDLLGASVNKCKVGYQSLRRAVEELAKLGRSGKDLTTTGYKTALAVLLIMCLEAARLKEIFEFWLSLLKAGTDDEVGEKNKLLINNWADTCNAFYQVNRDKKEIVISTTTPAKVRKVFDGVRILCRSKWDSWVEKNAPKPKKQNKVRNA